MLLQKMNKRGVGEAGAVRARRWARYRAAYYLSLEAVECERTVGCADCRLQSMRTTAADLNPRGIG